MWMRSSRRGLEIRAMMMNPHAAAIVGIGIRRTGLYATTRLSCSRDMIRSSPMRWRQRVMQAIDNPVL